MPIDVVSSSQFLFKPRYPDGVPLDSRLTWTHQDLVMLKTICMKGSADLEHAAKSFGRTPSQVADKAWRTGLSTPKGWWSALYSKNRSSRNTQPLNYPYVQEVRGEHEDLLLVNSLVPRGLPDHIRADVCQEIMLRIFMGETTVEELRSDRRLISKFIVMFRKQNYEMGGYAISLDQPLKNGGSWYDILPESESSEEKIFESFDELGEYLQ